MQTTPPTLWWTTTTYDALGRPTTIVGPDGAQTRYAYGVNAAGLTSETYDPNNHRTIQVSDLLGRLKRVYEYVGNNPTNYVLDSVTEYDYNALDLLTRVIDDHDNVTTISYDSAGRKISMRDPDMGTWGYTYDVAGNLVAQTDAEDQTTLFGYDNLNRLTTKIPPTYLRFSDTFDTKDTTVDSPWDWGTKQTVPWLDGSDNVVKSESDGHAWNGMERSSYSLAARHSVQLRFKVSANNTSAHFMVEANDPDGIHSAAHPRFGVKAEDGKLFVQSTDGTGFREVELLGELKTNQWYTLNLALDNAGGFTANVFPQGQPANGRAYRTTLPNAQGLTWRFRHMLWTGTAYMDDYAEYNGALYRYDAGTNGKGQRTSMANPAASQAWSYDERGRVKQVTYSISGLSGTRTMHTEYDAADRVKQLTYPSGEEVEYTYDAGGRQSKLHSNTYNVSYATTNPDEPTFDALDQPYSWRLGNGLYANWEYREATRRLYEVKVGTTIRGPETTAGHHLWNRYVYDDVGNVQKIANVNSLGQVREMQTFAYDERDRLISASGDGVTDGTLSYYSYSDTFAYDDIGNLTRKDGRTFIYPSSGVRPHGVTCANWSSSTCAANESYRYNSNGNLMSGGGRQFTWTAENQPATVTMSGVSESYLYDADNVRVKRTSNGTSTYYLGSMAEEMPSQSTWRQVYTFNGQVIAERSAAGGFGTEYNYLHGDHLGSIAATSSSNASPTVQRQYFTPWGEQRIGNGTGAGAISTQTTDRNFTGQRKDDTGLLFYNARYYDPKLARFISADSIVPGMASGAGGMGSIGADDSTGSMLTVDFHEPVFVAGVGAENTFTRERGFSFELSDEDVQDVKYQWGPPNPQALNRYSYVLNNPIRYTDPTGHSQGCGPGGEVCGGSGGGGRGGGGGRLPVPGVPASAKSVADFGNRIMRWGTGDAAARERISTLTRAELEQHGVTREIARAWRDFYRNEILRNPSNPSARGRAELMQRAFELLGGQ